jgi:hypothetical protein
MEGTSTVGIGQFSPCHVPSTGAGHDGEASGQPCPHDMLPSRDETHGVGWNADGKGVTKTCDISVHAKLYLLSQNNPRPLSHRPARLCTIHVDATCMPCVGVGSYARGELCLHAVHVSI